MPTSAAEPSRPADHRLAIWAEVLYLVNLLPAPVLGFLALLWLFFRQNRQASVFTACHLRQTVVASLWAGVLIIGVALVIVAVGGLQHPGTWVALLLYVVTVHSAFILVGVVGLTKAMAGRSYRYPLIGPRCGRE
jgi:uncharacterized Tic20 family protein